MENERIDRFISSRKLYKYLTKEKAISEAEVEAAKIELIQGIKDYDAAHTDKDNEATGGIYYDNSDITEQNSKVNIKSN